MYKVGDVVCFTSDIRSNNESPYVSSSNIRVNTRQPKEMILKKGTPAQITQISRTTMYIKLPSGASQRLRRIDSRMYPSGKAGAILFANSGHKSINCPHCGGMVDTN